MRGGPKLLICHFSGITWLSSRFSNMSSLVKSLRVDRRIFYIHQFNLKLSNISIIIYFHRRKYDKHNLITSKAVEKKKK